MAEPNWNDLDRALAEALPELPPESVVDVVTPWRRAMGQILAGLALTSVTLHFLGLQYFLPAVGTVLLLLGFRALRRAGRAFAVCYLISILRAVLLFVFLVQNAAILRFAAAEPWLTGGAVALQFAQLLSFYLALETAKRKAGMPDAPNSAGWLLLWYVLIVVLSLLAVNGVVVLVILALYVCILRSLHRLSGQIDAVGYAIEPAPVRLSDGALAGILAAALAVGIAGGSLFAGRYAMDWSPAEPPAQTETAARLKDLGFPEAVLRDLTPDDLAACAGALRVISSQEDHPVNPGREVREQEEGPSVFITTVYDRKELRITGAAVELPGDRWVVFHHFEWVENPGYFGTECIQLWPTSHLDGWEMVGGVTGRLLCEREGETLTAPYASLGNKTYTADSVFWGTQTHTEIFAAFSLPRNAEHQRGYLAYTVQSVSDVEYILDSWMNYTHQQTWMQYPVRTAQEARMSGADWLGEGAFVTVQDAVQTAGSEE